MACPSRFGWGLGGILEFGRVAIQDRHHSSAEAKAPRPAARRCGATAPRTAGGSPPAASPSVPLMPRPAAAGTQGLPRVWLRPVRPGAVASVLPPW